MEARNDYNTLSATAMAPLDDPMTLKGQTQAWLLLGLMLTACTMDDERDECCTDGSVVDFRYYYKNADRYDTYISSAQYYLFDASDGHYIGQLEGDEDDISVVNLDGLWDGKFSLIAIGNLDDYATVTGLDEGLDALRLVVTQAYGDDEESSSELAARSSTPIYASGDKLYWGQCDFTYTTGTTRRYIADMSNVHCRLLVRVEWEHLPTYTSGYVYELDGIGGSMDMTNAEAVTISSLQFSPVAYEDDRMREAVPLRHFALQARLYTLRWTNDDIPVFRLWNGDVQVTPDIALSTAFTAWNYLPDKTTVQDYEILITINLDGTVDVSQDLTGEISDWADGGTLG